MDAAILDIGGAIPWVRWYVDPKTGHILREKYKATDNPARLMARQSLLTGALPTA